MPDIHDSAMEWAQTNPTDPRAQDVLAKSWAAKNPNDPRAAQILQKVGAQDTAPSTSDKLLKMLYNPNPTMQDPETGKAVPIVAGSPPLAAPASALPGVAGVATKLGSNLLGRLGMNAAQGAVSGAVDNPSNRVQGAESGALLGGGIGVTGEIAGALGKGIKAAYKAFKPGSAEENIGNLKELLKGKAVTVNPAKLSAVDETGQVEHLLKQEDNPTVGESQYGVYGTQTPDTMEIPAEKAHEIRSILDKQVNWNSPAGPERAKEIAGASNDVRSQLHNLSPEVDAAYKDLESSLGANKNLSKATNEMSKGDLTHAYRLGTVPLAEGIKGSVRSLLSNVPQSATPAANMALSKALEQQK